MKKPGVHISLILILLSLVSSGTLLSQSGWFPCTSGTNKNLTSVYFVNQNTGWISGYLSSDDYHGVILKTTDGGSIWVMQVDEFNIQPESVFFTDANSGWAAGDRLFGLNKSVLKKTTNAGLNWVDISIPDSSIHTYSVYFMNQNTGWVTGRDIDNKVTVFKTTNSGLNWLVIETGFSSSTHGPRIQFVNENTGFLAALQLLKTTNGGTSWNTSDIGSNAIAAQPYFINNNTGWVTGYIQNPAAHFIKKTTDSGINWITQWLSAIVTGRAIYSTYFINSNTGWGAGSEYVNSSYIIKTTNGGATWGYQTSQTFLSALSSIFFVDSNYGWSAGTNGRVLRTTDGGSGISGIESAGVNFPDDYALKQNYPNPFNPETNIRFDIPENNDRVLTNVKLTVFDVIGREVSALINERLKPGKYEVNWNASGYPSGVYFYVLNTNNFNETKKMTLIK